jgi:hypothetical protein
MLLAIFGDSFGYQRPGLEYNNWVDLLGQHCEIVNHCENGIGEYKILKQLRQADLDSFDQILITHTSATRVFVPYNPLHQHGDSHKNCDIIYADVANRQDEFSRACQQYFKHIFDLDYAIDMHNMICKEIVDLCENKKVLHVTHFDYTGLYQFPGMINFHDLWLKNKGPVNHYNEFGNRSIFETLTGKLL